MNRKLTIIIYNLFHIIWMKYIKLNNYFGIWIVNKLSILKNRLLMVLFPIIGILIASLEFFYKMLFNFNYKISMYSMTTIYIGSILLLISTLIILYSDILRIKK